MVGLERTYYRVPENVGSVEVCIVVSWPEMSTTCPIEISFTLDLTLSDHSAGVYNYNHFFKCIH